MTKGLMMDLIFEWPLIWLAIASGIILLSVE